MSLSTGKSGAEAAIRLRKPSWRDPRLLAGLLLVLASVAGVTALVSGADRSTKVYVARSDITVGSTVTPDDLVAVAVRLGETGDAYIAAGEELPDGTIATTLLRKGELLPRRALGTADQLDRKPVGVSVDNVLPAGTVAGSHVDLWVAMPTGTNSYQEPELLLEGAEVSEIAETESALGTSSRTTIHLLVEDAKMPRLLAALANGARIAVVPNPGGGA
jgi:hypothetical protein